MILYIRLAPAPMPPFHGHPLFIPNHTRHIPEAFHRPHRIANQSRLNIPRKDDDAAAVLQAHRDKIAVLVNRELARVRAAGGPELVECQRAVRVQSKGR